MKDKLCPNCKNKMVWCGIHSEGFKNNHKVVDIYVCSNCNYVDDPLDNTEQILKTDPNYQKKYKRFIKNWKQYSKENKCPNI